jgi:hypothetical protein
MGRTSRWVSTRMCSILETRADQEPTLTANKTKVVCWPQAAWDHHLKLGCLGQLLALAEGEWSQ